MLFQNPPLRPKNVDIILLIFGGILVIILIYILYYIRYKSNSNPSKFINIRNQIVRVKPLNSDWWTRIEDWEVIQDYDLQNLEPFIIPERCPRCKVNLSELDKQQVKYPKCNYRFN